MRIELLLAFQGRFPAALVYSTITMASKNRLSSMPNGATKGGNHGDLLVQANQGSIVSILNRYNFPSENNIRSSQIGYSQNLSCQVIVELDRGHEPPNLDAELFECLCELVYFLLRCVVEPHPDLDPHQELPLVRARSLHESNSINLPRSQTTSSAYTNLQKAS